jgi:hypothetical protein
LPQAFLFSACFSARETFLGVGEKYEKFLVGAIDESATQNPKKVPPPVKLASSCERSEFGLSGAKPVSICFCVAFYVSDSEHISERSERAFVFSYERSEL